MDNRIHDKIKEEIFEILYGSDKVEIYRKFQEIEKNIEISNEMYKYFDEIKDMLNSNKAYVRIRGFRIICKLAKWDKENKINKIINNLLNELDDEKPTNVRQCLSALNDILVYKAELSEKVKEKIRGINLSKYSDSMAPLIKKDIEKIL